MFPSLPLADLTELDLALLVGVVLVHPLYSLINHRAEKRRDADGRPSSRLKQYRSTIMSHLTLGLAVAVTWALSGRAWAEIGLTLEPDLNFIAVGGAAVVASAAMLAHMIQVTRSPKKLAELNELISGMKGVDQFVPRTPAERNGFRAVSVSAGIFEELIYRGFLIWALAHWMPVWAAAAAALAVFVALHLYQANWNAIARVALTGAVLTLVVVLSGSLLPAMLLHAVVDWASGEMTSAARRGADAAAA